MKLLKNSIETIAIRRAANDADIKAAQTLRYKVFYEEFGASPIGDMESLGRDYDEFDDYADHLVVTDTDPTTKKETIIGTYRLMTGAQAIKQGSFLSSKSYDLTPLQDTGQKLLELSRSCILPEYRTKPVLQLLWRGIADYITEHEIEILFGCASFHTIDTTSIAEPLSYLYHHHLAPKAVRVRAQDKLYETMDLVPNADINVRKSFHNLPPLIKGYLRVGSTVGDGAVIDPQFGTIDVFISMQTHMISDRYRKHYNMDKKKDKDQKPKESTADNVARLLAGDI